MACMHADAPVDVNRCLSVAAAPEYSSLLRLENNVVCGVFNLNKAGCTVLPFFFPFKLKMIVYAQRAILFFLHMVSVVTEQGQSKKERERSVKAMS